MNNIQILHLIYHRLAALPHSPRCSPYEGMQIVGCRDVCPCIIRPPDELRSKSFGNHLFQCSDNAPIFSPFYNVIWLRVDCRNRSNRSGSAAFLHPALAVPDCSALCFESLATSNTEIISVACRNICIIRCEQPIIHHLLDFLSSLPSSAPGGVSRVFFIILVYPS